MRNKMWNTYQYHTTIQKVQLIRININLNVRIVFKLNFSVVGVTLKDAHNHLKQVRVNILSSDPAWNI